jgi:hypothetical protein
MYIRIFTYSCDLTESSGPVTNLTKIIIEMLIQFLTVGFVSKSLFILGISKHYVVIFTKAQFLCYFL